MKILINAINLKDAGGLTVALNFIQQLNTGRYPNTEATVLAPPNIGYEDYKSSIVTVEIVPSRVANPIWRLFMDYIWVKNRIEEIAPDVIFSMGNFALPTKRKQAVLFMWPYAIYLEDKAAWQIMSRFNQIFQLFKTRVFRTRLKYASIVFPQTITSEQRLKHYYPEIKKTKIIPMAYSTLGTGKPKTITPLFEREDGMIYFLCLTKYYTHKNVEIFLPLAHLIKKHGLPFRIVSTIGENQHTKASIFINRIHEENLEDILINIGSIPVDQVSSLYALTDALLLPTLLESFSATYADAMFYKKPIFTSNKDFAKDVCDDCAFYFNPHNPEDILNTIKTAFSNSDLLKEKIDKGYLRSQSFPNWEQVADMYLAELQELADEKRNNI